MKRMHRAIRLGVVLVGAPLIAGVFTGCATYSLQGKVIAGDISYVAVVGEGDERLEGPGLAGVTISLETDPGKLKREHVGDAVSGAAGEFSIRVDRAGAGVLIYDVGIKAQRAGYEGVQQIFRLPPSGRRVLILLHPGVDQLKDEEESLMEQYNRFKSH